jgi:PAS domain S-box-containing protein
MPTTPSAAPSVAEIHCAHVRDFQSAAEAARQMGKRRELPGRRKDGAIFPTEASIAKTNSGDRSVFTAILRDDTERKQAEEALRKSEARFRALIEKSKDAVAIVDERVNVKYESPAVARILGYTPEERVGKNGFDLLHPDDLPRAANLLQSLVGTPGSSVSGEFRLRSRDGSWCWLDTTGTNLLEDPSVQGIVVNYHDVMERKQAETRIQTQLQRLATLRAIDTAITGSLDLKLVLNVLLEQTTAQLGMDAASVLLLNPHTQTLTYAAGRGFRTRAIEQSRESLGEGFTSQVILEQQMVHLHNPSQSPDFARATLLAGEDFVEFYAAPLSAKGRIIGVLEVFHRAPNEVDDEWRNFLETLAGQAAIAVDNAQLFQDLQHSNTNLILAYDATIEGWSRALDLRDKETEGHTQRVTAMTERLALAMDISDEKLLHIRRGALLHDIGKMGVPDKILLKPDKLTDGEWAIMRQHPQFAFDMLAPIAYLRPALDIPGCHHEKWDGTGYPRGLKGEQIPLAARLFAVVDVWDALRSDRPYRQGWPEGKVLEHIRTLAGTHFDPKAVELFFTVMNEDTKGMG